jgi:hypothetical protein
MPPVNFIEIESDPNSAPFNLDRDPTAAGVGDRSTRVFASTVTAIPSLIVVIAAPRGALKIVRAWR